ncbi:MAG: pyridoxal-phosphate dependent enzyme [Gemmatimonadales bacterium]|nr:pyridoxal-phosphate dependent enzyme [Gemmatimonadales bacterium]NIN13488.1 pyridoxal-phosphate dependent enzyme [Gemmatimonadales bacterium]NIQ99640.1 pyridoxal-phosphate dependent enzyme [Gemmatimonadales bacterium]NIS64197.1 pyridoxal-phosphate dependent enzyme [Gemmatimonadales bacterium]
MPYDVAAARKAISGIAIETPVLSVPSLSDRVGAPVALKLENLQVTGSFKVRGAANRMLALTDEEKSRGVVACSSGNHGRAVAYVAELLGIPATVCVPEWVDPSKLEAIRNHGSEAILYGKTYDDTAERSLEIQRERRLTYVHPFDDPHVIAGQGTIGLELLEQLPSVDTVLVPLSAGGLIGGIGLALKSHAPTIRLIGVSAKPARVMYESLKAGHPIEFPEEETIANALSGGIGLDNQHTFRLVREYVDEHILVEEAEIREAMAFGVKELKLVIEGGGAVGLAALIAGKIDHPVENVAVVVSGGNVDPRMLLQVVAETEEARGM